jgi:hypothetical protein
MERRRAWRDFESIEAAKKFEIIQGKKKNLFGRGKPVALKNDPDVSIGNVINPPGTHNPTALIKVASGGSRPYRIWEEIVPLGWKEGQP